MRFLLHFSCRAYHEASVDDTRLLQRRGEGRKRPSEVILSNCLDSRGKDERCEDGR